jgi:hypothetical protein
MRHQEIRSFHTHSLQQLAVYFTSFNFDGVVVEFGHAHWYVFFALLKSFPRLSRVSLPPHSRRCGVSHGFGEFVKRHAHAPPVPDVRLVPLVMKFSLNRWWVHLDNLDFGLLQRHSQAENPLVKCGFGCTIVGARRKRHQCQIRRNVNQGCFTVLTFQERDQFLGQGQVGKVIRCEFELHGGNVDGFRLAPVCAAKVSKARLYGCLTCLNGAGCRR